jgi:hypothetical protein
MPVLAVGRHDGVIWTEGLHQTNGNSLFAIVKMYEAADPGGAVQLRALALKATDTDHLTQQLQTVLTVELNEGRGGRVNGL